MRASQSRTTADLSSSGGWHRTEQFAALRYVSRHRETDAAVDLAMGESSDLPAVGSSFVGDVGSRGGQAAPAWRLGEPLSARASAAASSVTQDAEDLLQVIRFCNSMLADETISLEDRSRYSAELQLLRDRGWELMQLFLSGMQGPDDTSATRLRRIRQEDDAAGWLASC